MNRYIVAATIVIATLCQTPMSSAQPGSTTASQSSNTAAASVANLLPTGTFRVNVIAPKAAPQAQMLIAKMRMAVSKDPQWLIEHSKKSKPGEPLVYDPRLGLTPAEYKKAFLDSDNMELFHAGVANLTVTEKDGVYALNGGDVLPDLNGLTIDTRKDIVTTPIGATEKGAPFDRIASRPLEFGRRWQVLKGFADKTPGTPFSGAATYLTLGKELPSKPFTFDDFLVWLNLPRTTGPRQPHGVLLYSIFSAKDQKPLERNLMLTFALPPEKPVDEDSPLLALSLCGMSRWYANLGEPDRAQAAFTKSLAIMRKVKDPEALQNYIEALFRIGRRTEIAEFREQLKKVSLPPAAEDE